MEEDRGSLNDKNPINSQRVFPLFVIFFLLISLSVNLYFFYNQKTSKRLITTETKDRVVSTPVVQPTFAIKAPVTPFPEVSAAEDKILSAILDRECEIKIKASNKTFSLPTEYQQFGSTFCDSSKYGKISPSGKYLAYDGMTGGIDSMFSIFSLRYGKSFTLGVWGTSTIMDYVFLPDDRLAVIFGYPDIFNEQYIKLFDIPKIFADYRNNFNLEHLYLRSSNPVYESNVTLPDTNTTHVKLVYENEKLQTKSKEGKVLVQYSTEDIIMNSGGFGITPKTALMLVHYFDEKNVKSVDNPITVRNFDIDNSNNEFWAVSVDNIKTKQTLRRYVVNRKTGEVTFRI